MIHVVLYEPEIPGNTGNIIRTCMATGSRLHLIEPLGFSLEDKYLRRSGMDYIKDADIEIHPNWQAFGQAYPDADCWFITRYGHKAPWEYDFKSAPGDIFLVLGKESTGVDKHILRAHMDRLMRLPMVPNARSLNLSNSAAVAVYEVIRQTGGEGLSKDEYLKGDHWLETLPLS